MGNHEVGMTVIGVEGIGQWELMMKLEGCDGREEQAKYIVGTSDADAHSYTIFSNDSNLPLGPPPLFNPDPPHTYLNHQYNDDGEQQPFSFWTFPLTHGLPQIIVLAYSSTNRQTFLDLTESYDEAIKRIAHARTVQSSSNREGGFGPVHIIIAGFSTHGGRQSRGIQVSREEVRKFAHLKNEQHRKEREERWMDIEIEFLKEMQRDARIEEEWAVAKRERERSDKYWAKKKEDDAKKEHNKRCREYWIKTLGGKWGEEKVKREREEAEKKYWADFFAWKEYKGKVEEGRRRGFKR
ncbi:hypothetical protein B0T20DRAFT_104718 [Sordaria brevicollis]|uniref:Uncharacterized protein n=1 Tax=Sordaria brevicollis TaxID=83679 RepID=A0AAE0NVK4_SORBR|nr:hypothetical protein B0T20DRAFT_104718 [Sordaria brevicollis]